MWKCCSQSKNKRKGNRSDSDIVSCADRITTAVMRSHLPEAYCYAERRRQRRRLGFLLLGVGCGLFLVLLWLGIA
ncbi:MAG: hypothetical protein E7618_03695 [Ruminococcaceae bacterium]|nr:hypothetical protein [Oscillospiraceae bacterium]